MNGVRGGFWQQIATVGPIGWLPAMPGTWGSAAACVIWWFALSTLSIIAQACVIALLIPIAIISASKSELMLGHDAKPIVIDEVAGQWITLLAVPRELIWVGVGFILFRVFDVMKPFPVYQSQRLPEGWGIVIDDLLAGGYATAGVLIARHYLIG